MAESGEQDSRIYDVVVWGASGFTGRLVVEYLLGKYPPDGSLCWAVAGRDQAKLEKMLAELDTDNLRPAILIADSHDQDSIDQIVQSTRVILSTVGPYARYGSELVRSCVNNGTDYCDLCGEVQWMQKMIDIHQAPAERSGARIVMSCGFDSIPSDIGVWSLQQQALKIHGEICASMSLLVYKMKGTASGGTIASMLNAIDEARRDKEVASILLDPYALNPVGERNGPDGSDQSGSAYVTDEGVWTGPFVMAGVNTRVVRRSNALLGYAFGKDFRYHEASITGPGIRGRIKAQVMSIGLKLFLIASAIPLTRRLLVQKLLPEPGEGPSKQDRDDGYFNLLLTGRLRNGLNMRMRIKGDRDPGYGSTSKMLAESAICLALDKLHIGGGFWTPASAMGEPLLRRLTDNAGLSFKLE